MVRYETETRESPDAYRPVSLIRATEKRACVNMEEDDCHPRLPSDLTCVLMVRNSHSRAQTHTYTDTCHFKRLIIIVLEILSTESVNSHSGTDGVLSFPKWKISCQVCLGLPPGSWGRAGPLFRMLNPLYCVLTGPFPTSSCCTSGIIVILPHISHLPH